MRLFLLLSQCAIFFVVFVSVKGRCKPESELTKMERYILYSHNRWRRLHKNTPDLCYGISDETHTYTPKQWSEALLKTNIKGTFGLPVSDNTDVGENNYWSCIKSDPILPLHYRMAAVNWYGEMNEWRYRKSTRMPYEFMLRFTQLVWKNSLEVNCGWSVGVPGQYVTCQYYPPGNDRRRMEEFVEDPKTSWNDVYGVVENIHTEDRRRAENNEPEPDHFKMMEDYEKKWKQQQEKENTEKEEENEPNDNEKEKEEEQQEPQNKDTPKRRRRKNRGRRRKNMNWDKNKSKSSIDVETELDQPEDLKAQLLWDKLVDAVDIVQDIIDSE